MAIWILLATLVSEDAAAVWAGWLVRLGELGTAEALAACGLNIYLGDAGLWLAGRAVRRSDRVHGWCVRRVPRVLGRALALAVDEPAAIVASRFLPGTRLPLYLAAARWARSRRCSSAGRPWPWRCGRRSSCSAHPSCWSAV